jgi:hypothetical protein
MLLKREEKICTVIEVFLYKKYKVQLIRIFLFFSLYLWNKEAERTLGDWVSERESHHQGRGRNDNQKKKNSL